MLYDVGIVGAGPAGGYAAYLLAKRGLSVLVLDREAFPRDKVCGGGISRKTLDLLDFDVTPVVERRIAGAYLTYQNADTIVRDMPGRAGVTTTRRDLDLFILEQAIGKGATFRPRAAFEGADRRGDCLEVRTSSGTCRTRYLLGADGVFSQVRRCCFEPGLVEYVPAVEALVSVDPATIERLHDRVLFDFGGMPHGYGWIFPKADHLNVGVFSVFPSRSIKGALRAFIARYPSLRDAMAVRFLGSAIPLRNTRNEFQRGNVWLVGDAAGFAESFYGEGIYFALKSAVVAASALAEDFDRPGSDLYARKVRRQLLPDLRYSRISARLFFSAPRFGFDRMVRNVVVSRWFAELIAGGVSHRECFYKTALSLPYWLVSGIRAGVRARDWPNDGHAWQP